MLVAILVPNIKESDAIWQPASLSLIFCEGFYKLQAFHWTDLISVDDQPDEALQDHWREQVHVDAGHSRLPEFPRIEPVTSGSRFSYLTFFLLY